LTTVEQAATKQQGWKKLGFKTQFYSRARQ